MRNEKEFNTSNVQGKDNHVLHPWEYLQFSGKYDRPVIVKSDGIYLFDSNGQKLIDGPGGMWNINLGHNNKEIIEAITKQASKMVYASPWTEANIPASELAYELEKISPPGFSRTFFTTGGSTAVDSALRFIMFFNNYLGRPNKKHIISRHDAYHGSTFLSASCSGKERDRNNFDFYTNYVHHISSPNPYKKSENMNDEEFCDFLIEELESKIISIGKDNVAAFIAEPVLGSGGVIVPPKGYNRRCSEVCKKHDVIYIADETVTAFGRLGAFFASDTICKSDPDIITCAKGITSGYIPLGAVLISDRVFEKVSGEKAHKAIFANGFTNSGHPLAAAAALKTIEIIKRDKILEHVQEVGSYFQKRMHELREFPIVGDVRGMRLMACIETRIGNKKNKTLEEDLEIGKIIDKHATKLGLVVRPYLGLCVLSPPLIIQKKQIDDIISILKKAIKLAMSDLREEGIWKD